jgi:hypothetical protein
MISFKKRRVPFRHIAAIAVVALMFGLVNVATVQRVFAQVDIGPNADWFGGQDTVRYVLEEDGPVTGAGNQNIPIYVFNGSTTIHPTITVTASDSSSGYSGTMAAACISLSGSCSGTWCQINPNCAFTIPPSSFVYDPTVGGWTAMVYAHLMQGGIHEFRLTASNGATIGYYASKNPADRSFAAAHTYTAGHRYQYAIPFGSDCTVPAGGQAVSANIYDGDVGNNGIQPLPFRVRVIDDTSGLTVVDQNYTTVAQANAAGLGNNGTATYSWIALPNHNYRFILDNVASHNTLQFRLPFSSIYYNTTCFYNLTPTTSVTPDSSEANTTVKVNPSVNNTGTMSSSGTQWQLSKFIVPPGQNYPGAGTSASTPAIYYGHGLTSIGSGNNQTYPVGVTSLTPTTDNLGSQPVGTKVCYALSVKAVSDTNNNWAHGTPSCVIIAKKPKVQVWGGDLSVGSTAAGGSQVTSSITTSISQQVAGVFGSWSEYGVQATGLVTGFGSGSAYNGGLVTYSTCAVSQLAFTSAGTSACSGATPIGNYISGQSIPNVGAVFPISSSTPTFSGIGDTTQRRVETASGTVNIGGGTVQSRDWLVLNAPSATVNITGSITYTNATLHSAAEIPQVVIIANCINIAGGVTQVDAWLIATGSGAQCDGIAGGGVLNTCGDVAAGADLSSSICSNTLRVNGPVMATHLYLQRTAGAGPGAAAGDPAEVFNLRPDAYMWLAERSVASGYIQAVYTTELPPRF